MNPAPPMKGLGIRRRSRVKRIDKVIRFKLAQEAKHARLEPAAGCLSDLELNRYLSGDLVQPEKALIEEHLAVCYLCLDKLVSSYEGEKLLAKRKIKRPPKHITWKAKNIERTGNTSIKNRIDFALGNEVPLPKTKKLSATENAVIKWLPKNLRKNKWLISSITAFALSFAFPPVFLQFLLAAGILGGKWIFDSENTKTLIMIYNAWKKGGEKEASRMIEALKSRIPTKK